LDDAPSFFLGARCVRSGILRLILTGEPIASTLLLIEAVAAIDAHYLLFRPASQAANDSAYVRQKLI